MTGEQTAASEPAAGTTRTLEESGITLVYVPAGEFMMGSAADDSEATDREKPAHLVYLDAYWIGQTEVTNAQYRRFVEAGGYSKRGYWTSEGWQWKQENKITMPEPVYINRERFRAPLHPVVLVNWYEATAFSRWAGARLPTEAEWEYAARGGPLSRGYRYSGSDDLDEVAWYLFNSLDRIYPVGQKRPNELGLYDMSGSVCEWCADGYDAGYYSRSPRKNPSGPPSGEARVFRGGSWDNAPVDVRCTYRMAGEPDWRPHDYVGFRVVVVP